MADIISIPELMKDFKEVTELKKYCEMQYKTIEYLQKKTTQLEMENNHLKEVLSGAVPVVQETKKIEVSTEQAIAEIQLERLKNVAVERELTLEETKKYDLLVKNLMVSKPKKKEIDASWKNLENVSPALLIEAAGKDDSEK